ncbi:MAG: glycosyltransferase family 25 protein [Bdellovibrionales bacterium]
MTYTGFFINLDRNPERRAKMEAQLAQRGLQDTYRRFTAVEGNAMGFPNPSLKEGEMGVFSTHCKLLKENLGTNKVLHIIEDDILLAACMQDAIQSLMAQNLFDTYDIIYTDTQVPTSNVYYKTYKTLFDRITKRDAAGRVGEVTFQVIDLREGKFGTASSLLISPKAVNRLHDLYIMELTKGPALPLDLFMWRLVTQNTMRAACLFPFVTSLRLEHSLDTSIAARYDQLSVLARDIVRASFFVDRDLAGIRDMMNRHLQLPDDPHLQILMHALGYSFTDKFVDI